MFGFCDECDRETSHLVNRDGYSSCENCGLVDPHFIHLVYQPSFDGLKYCRTTSRGRTIVVDMGDCEEETLDSGVFGDFSFASQFLSTKGRYKPIFHWNERIAQLSLADPEIPDKVMERIWFEVFDGSHGPREDFTRGNVLTILKKLRLSKYAERWKRILHDLNPNFQVKYPTQDFIERLEHVYAAVESRFFDLKHQMPKSVIRKTNGDVRIQDRHSVLPFNYLFRKICEAWDIWDWHDELPLLRSASKLHNLDDFTKVIFDMIGLKFRRSVVLKRPKSRKKKSTRKLGHRHKHPIEPSKLKHVE